MKVNDYVRTNEFGIQKVKWFVNEEPILENGFTALQKEYKSSPNIIDLIEAGDYVNGYKVLNVLDFNDNTRVLSLEKIYDSKIVEEDIKSILTKEMFESMKYKVKE